MDIGERKKLEIFNGMSGETRTLKGAINPITVYFKPSQYYSEIL